jgi:hypothetical protein
MDLDRLTELFKIAPSDELRRDLICYHNRYNNYPKVLELLSIYDNKFRKILSDIILANLDQCIFEFRILNQDYHTYNEKLPDGLPYHFIHVGCPTRIHIFNTIIEFYIFDIDTTFNKFIETALSTILKKLSIPFVFSGNIEDLDLYPDLYGSLNNETLFKSIMAYFTVRRIHSGTITRTFYLFYVEFSSYLSSIEWTALLINDYYLFRIPISKEISYKS